MFANRILGSLALLSVGLMLWQWLVAWRFPLHQRRTGNSWAPPVTLLKPLKGCDQSTEACLRSWLSQSYSGAVQVLFGVAVAEDPVCGIVRKLLEEFPAADARLVICGQSPATNAKVSKLAELERLASHEILVISDADVKAPADLLAHLLAPLQNGQAGLIHCFYEIANPTTLAMRWEAVAMNADFWSQVLQARSLRPLDFGLGAVMAIRRSQLAEIGGFTALENCLADDFQLGHRIAARGYEIELCNLVVECWSGPMDWAAVWKHQTRWARTIRVCQPAPYFFSILSNPTIWPLMWLLANPSKQVAVFCLGVCLARTAMAYHLQWRLTQLRPPLKLIGLVLLKDLLQTPIWALAFLGNDIEWRGEKMRLRRDGTLVKIG